MRVLWVGRGGFGLVWRGVEHQFYRDLDGSMGQPWTHERFTEPDPWWTAGTAGSRVLVCPVCPDLLDYAAIGAADNWRGRVVRAFFWIMRAWPA